MKKIILLLATIALGILLISCNEFFGSSGPIPEKQAEPTIGDYRCKEKEYRKVMIESTYCTDRTSYLSTFCYKEALRANCKLKVTKSKRKQ